MSEVIAASSSFLERLRRQAKELKKRQGIPHHEALDAVARAQGRFPDWHHVIEAAKASAPAEQAFAHGLVIGADIKDALEPVRGQPPRSFPNLVEDERLASFVVEDFRRGRDARWEEGDEDWIVHETMYFLSRGEVSVSPEEAMRIAFGAFPRGPVYVRLRGKILWNFIFEDGDE